MQRQASGVITNGSYTIEEVNGPNLGEYRVMITGSNEVPSSEEAEEEEDADDDDDGPDPDEAAAMPNIVPDKYGSRSELKVSITSGSNTHDFQLTTGS
jgi:hypothetical protein